MECPVCPPGPHRSRKREMWVLWTLLGRPNYSHLALGAGYFTERILNGLKEWAKNKESQWHAQSAHLAHTGHVKGKCGFSGC